MSQHDVSLAQEYFNHPTQVFLSLKPAADGSSSAGFFFRDSDRIGPDFSYPEFPFDARQLATALEIPADSSPEGKEQRLASVLRWRWFPIVAALVVAMTALGYIALQKRAASLAPTSVASQTAGLALEIERHENDLRLRWNVNSPVVYYAKDAMLSIHDGNSLQEVHLDRKQLFNRGVVYRPVNAAVQFRLEITALDNTKTSEYVLVLRAAAAAAANVLGATSIAATSRTDAPRKRPRLAGLLSGKKPLVQSFGKLPSICSAGDVIRKTDAPPGWDMFVCRSKNVWSLVGDAAIAGNRTESLAKKRN